MDVEICRIEIESYVHAETKSREESLGGENKPINRTIEPNAAFCVILFGQVALNSHGTLRNCDELKSTTGASNPNSNTSGSGDSGNSSSGSSSTSSSSSGADAHSVTTSRNGQRVVLRAFPSDLALLYKAMHDFGVVALPGIVCVPKLPLPPPPPPLTNSPDAAGAPSTTATAAAAGTVSSSTTAATAAAARSTAFEATTSDKSRRCLRLSFVGPEANYLVAAQRLRKLILFLCAQPIENN